MKKSDFLIIAITSSASYPEEAHRISDILKTGEADIVHIRKPEWPLEDVATLIKEIPEKFHSRLKVHDHFELLNEFNLGGVHLNSRNPVAPNKAKSVSKSCHSVEELKFSDYFDYVTLSPIFDSISKEGYKSSFTIDELRWLITGKKVIALGGVTPDKFDILKESGFYGAALLGHFFPKIN